MPPRLENFPIDQLAFEAQVRRHLDKASLQSLAKNIGEIGIQQPILIRMVAGQSVVLDGERRTRAARLAGLTSIPAMIIDDPLTIADILARQLSTAIHREPLTAFERADAVDKLMEETGMTGEQIAVKLSLSASSVSKLLQLRKIPQPIREQMAAGWISNDSGYLLSRVADPARQTALADRVVSEGLTRDELAAEIKRLESPTSARSKSPTWRMTRTIGPGIALAVSGTTLSLEKLVGLLEGFLSRAKSARGQGIALAPFLSSFKHVDATSKQESAI